MDLLGVFFLDKNPKKKKKKPWKSCNHSRAQQLHHTDHHWWQLYNEEATFGQRPTWAGLTSTKHLGLLMIKNVKKKRRLMKVLVERARIETVPFWSSREWERDGQASRERECILYWGQCWWVCSQRGSSAGSAERRLSSLCQLSTFGHVSAMWSRRHAAAVPLIPGWSLSAAAAALPTSVFTPKTETCPIRQL